MATRTALCLPFLVLSLSLPSRSVPTTLDEARPSFCNETEYGEPNLASCSALLYGGPDEAFRGIENLDFSDHAFLSSFAANEKDFTAEQWKNRVYLPMFWENSEFPSSKAQRQPQQQRPPLEPQSSHTQPQVGCKVALILRGDDPREFYKYDTGYFQTVASDTKKLIDKCLGPSRRSGVTQSGGRGPAGKAPSSPGDPFPDET